MTDYKVTKVALELFNENGKWKYDSAFDCPDTLEEWEIGNYLRDYAITLDGVTCTSIKWLEWGGFILVKTEVPKLVF